MNINDRITFVKEELDNAEALFESVKGDYNSMKGTVIIVFGHMIKYELVKYKQDGDWLRSIRLLLQPKYLKILSNTNVRKMFNDNIDDLYKDARLLVYGDLKKDYKRFNAISPIDRPNYFTIDNIVNKDWVYNFLINNACSYQTRKDLKIKGDLTPEQKAATEVSYTLQEAFPGIR